ncbi:MAG: ABC transporter ATP-binding protein [Chlamydiales bacterium]|nr:ABC transporter ATP-binding protein [Chlamydiia bacterium]MCP5508193.1 ABC transporter ATP-binding protein [Chlamydiales bacterium]
MNDLLKVVFGAKKHLFLMSLTIFAMCLLTFASQMEIVALGVITKKGPSFFELFASENNDKPTNAVSRQQVEKEWDAIAVTPGGDITKESAADYLASSRKGDFLQRVMNFLDQQFGITGNLMTLAMMLVAIALFKAVSLFTHRYATKLVAIRVSRDLRLGYFEHIQSLPMSFYQQYKIGSLSSRVVNDAYLIAEAVNSCLVNYLQTPFTIVTTLILCFLTSWKLSLLIFIGLPLIVTPIIYIARRVKRVSRQILSNQDHFLSILIDFISGIQTVKVFNMEQFSLNKYKEHNEQLARLEEKAARYDTASRPVVHTIGMLFLAAIMLTGLYVMNMSVPEILIFCGFLYIFYEPIKKFAEENSRIQRGVAASERLLEVTQLKPQITDRDGALTLEGFNDSLVFDDVWFSYGAEWILKGVSFKINKGETVAIVGPTGAGKSTIVNLIPRLYDIQRGQILIDGISLTEYTQRSLRDHIAYVPQKPFLFVDTVANNIAFGSDFSQKEITSAAKRAHADDFIENLSEKYQTVLSEAGKNLSGGQQQRLTIARALIKDAPILIMDEATSSLDMVSENKIKGAIHDLRGEMTQIIIAHRLTTIEDADKIIYLEDGRKIAEGTKDELLESCEGFRLMWAMMNRTTPKEDPQLASVT